MLRGERGLDEGLCQPPSLVLPLYKSPTQRIIRKWEQNRNSVFYRLHLQPCLVTEFSIGSISSFLVLCKRQVMSFEQFDSVLSSPSIVAEPWNILAAPRILSRSPTIWSEVPQTTPRRVGRGTCVPSIRLSLLDFSQASSKSNTH